MKEHMIKGLSPCSGRLDVDPEVLLDLPLTDVFVPNLRPEGRLPLLVFLQGTTAHNTLGHGLTLGLVG